MTKSFSRVGHFWSSVSNSKFNEFFLRPFQRGEKFHFVFFSGYFSPNHYHLYQLVQLAQLQKLNPKNAFLHVILTDVGLHTRRHTDYSAIAGLENTLENENHLLQIKGALLELGVPESNIQTYLFSDLLVTAFNKRKDLLIEFYRGLSEIQNDILEISEVQRKKFSIPPKGKYTIGYVIQKYGILFLVAHFEQIFHEEMSNGRTIPIFGDSGRPIVEKLSETLFALQIIPQITFSLNMDVIQTFGTDKSKTSSLSIPTAGMSTIEIARIVKAYSIVPETMKDIYEKLITPVLSREWAPSISHHTFSEDLCATLNKLVSHPAESVDLTVNDLDGISKVASLLRSPIARDILHHCDGTKTITEISRLTRKHVSNVSTIIRQLKEASLIELTTGKPRKLRRAIKIILN